MWQGLTYIGIVCGLAVVACAAVVFLFAVIALTARFARWLSDRW